MIPLIVSRVGMFSLMLRELISSIFQKSISMNVGYLLFTLLQKRKVKKGPAGLKFFLTIPVTIFSVLFIVIFQECKNYFETSCFC